MSVRIRSAALAISAVALALPAAVPAFAAGDLKIAHSLPSGAPRDQGAHIIANMVNKDDRCDLDAKVFPGSQLGSTEVVVETMQIGGIEMTIQPASFLVGFEPLIGIMDFPIFWPDTREELAKIHKSEAMRALLDTTEKQNIYTLMVWHTGYKTWTANKPLITLEDYQGVKARAMPSAILIEQDIQLGMTPVGMPFSETYTALQTKAIDAQENPIVTSFFMKFHEEQDYMTLSNHGTLDQLIMVGKSWWDGLPAECHTAILEAAVAGGKVTEDQTYAIIEKANAAFAKSGMKVVEMSPAETTLLRDAILPEIEEFYVEKNGAEGERILAGFKQYLSQ